jgi:hypothetical protein
MVAVDQTVTVEQTVADVFERAAWSEALRVVDLLREEVNHGRPSENVVGSDAVDAVVRRRGHR